MHPFIRLTFFVATVAFITGQSLAAETPTAKPEQFFHAQKIDGRWWLIAPDGKRFISKGVTTVQFAQDVIQNTTVSPYSDTNKAKYGNPAAWRKAVAFVCETPALIEQRLGALTQAILAAIG